MSSSPTAVIDIGTNTVILLIGKKLADGSLQILHEEGHVVRLGEGIHNRSEFLPAAMDRTFAVMADFKATANRLGCAKILAAGTAGFRAAKNAEVFQKRVLAELGFPIEVISGEREAHLIYTGSTRDFNHVAAPRLVLDIGGGSTEFIFEDAAGTLSETSLPFGCVRLTERFLKSDPPTEAEISALCDFVRAEIGKLKRPLGQLELIATAGTPTTLLALQLKLDRYDVQKVHGGVLSYAQALALTESFEKETMAERGLRPCLEPKRADVMVAGARILLTIMSEFGITRVHVSDRGLRYGLLFDTLNV